jgi:protein-S-isoprenylcysteine O-methyltransferase Ste14
VGVSRIRIVVASLLFPLVVGTVIFLAAGRWDFPFVWGVLGTLTLLCIALSLTVGPDLIRERTHPGPGSRERLVRPLVSLMLLVHWIVAGLDIGRFHWSEVSCALQTAGLVGYAVAAALVDWAVISNPFYSTVVRIQSDRGHYAVTRGPYRYVRHPGYTATILGAWSAGIALGSWVALTPLVLMTLLFLRRTAIEDRMLIGELSGYASYAERVRYRLAPGIY